jgi:hypothetical protein
MVSNFKDYTKDRIEIMEKINDLMFKYHQRCLGRDATPEEREEERLMRKDIEDQIKVLDIDYWSKIVVSEETKVRSN